MCVLTSAMVKPLIQQKQLHIATFSQTEMHAYFFYKPVKIVGFFSEL
jgi:hypothetical protein